MVKKLKSIAENQSSAKAGQIADSVKDSAQQIWLAGMGAFSKTQQEGSKVFEALVKEGMTLQRKTQGMAEDKISEVTGRMSAMAETVTARAGQNWDKLESIFEQRTAKAMGKLGVPTASDIEALTMRVDALAAAVHRLVKVEKPAKAAKAAHATGAKKVAPEKTATKATSAAPTQATPRKRSARKSAAA